MINHVGLGLGMQRAILRTFEGKGVGGGYPSSVSSWISFPERFSFSSVTSSSIPSLLGRQKIGKRKALFKMFFVFLINDTFKTFR